MKTYKTDSPIEKAVQEVEALLCKLGLVISSNGPIVVTHNGCEGRLYDVESNDDSPALPRFTDSERIVATDLS